MTTAADPCKGLPVLSPEVSAGEFSGVDTARMECQVLIEELEHFAQRLVWKAHLELGRAEQDLLLPDIRRVHDIATLLRDL
jgi:hypothetical protein